MTNSTTPLGEVNTPFFIEYHQYKDASSMAYNHYHNVYEIYYMLEGQRYYFIKDRTYNIMKGDIVLININEVHRTFYSSGSTNSQRVLINFDSSYIDDFTKNDKDTHFEECFTKNINVIRLNINEQQYIEALLSRMKSEKDSTETGHIVFTKILLIELLIFLNRTASRIETAIYEHPSAIHKKISDMVVFINNNYAEDITLGFMAKKYHISLYHLSRLFKRVTGFSFIEYLNLVRVRAAQKVLTETSLKVSQVANDTGFDSITHFGRTFKSVTGLSPLQYRKKH